MAERVIASFNSYAGMIQALKARGRSLAPVIANPRIAEAAGLPRFLHEKLVSEYPIKRIPIRFLGPILAVLAAKIVMVVDENSESRYTNRIPKRIEHCAHLGGAIAFSFPRAHFSKIAAKALAIRWSPEGRKMHAARQFERRKRHEARQLGGQNSRKNMSPKEATRIARKAARARWAKAAARTPELAKAA